MAWDMDLLPTQVRPETGGLSCESELSMDLSCGANLTSIFTLKEGILNKLKE